MRKDTMIDNESRMKTDSMEERFCNRDYWEDYSKASSFLAM